MNKEKEVEGLTLGSKPVVRNETVFFLPAALRGISQQVKSVLLQACRCPYGSRRFRLPRFLNSRHMKVARLSALHTGRRYSPLKFFIESVLLHALWPPLLAKRYSWYSFLSEAESLQGHSACRRTDSMKNFNGLIGNRSRYLPACSAVPQPTSPPRIHFIATDCANLLAVNIISWQETDFF